MTYELTKENHDEIADKILFEIADFVKKVEGFGYMVQTPYWYSDVLALELIPNSANKYLPIIKLAPFHKEKTGTKYCTCTLQITSFGFYLRDFKEFLKACKQAAKLVKYLETVDFSTFPTVI